MDHLVGVDDKKRVRVIGDDVSRRSVSRCEHDCDGHVGDVFGDCDYPLAFCKSGPRTCSIASGSDVSVLIDETAAIAASVVCST